MDNHPQLDILSSPDPDCPVAAYGGCMQWCWLATDFIQSPGSAAFATIFFFFAGNKTDGRPVIIAGYNFQTGTPTTFNEFSMQGGSQLSHATELKTMLEANFSFGQEYEMDFILFPPPGAGVSITAKEVGVKDNFIFDVSGINPPRPFVFSSNGTNPSRLTEYKIIVEIWTCEDGVRQSLVSTQGYEPNFNTAELCVDIIKDVASLVQTTWPGLLPETSGWILDETIQQEICLRYGQAFDTGSGDCDIQVQYMEISSPRFVINSAIQKDDPDGMQPFCFNVSGPDTRFLTNRPQTQAVCMDSYLYLWYIHQSQDIVDDEGGIAFPLYIINYTDATSGVIQGNNFSQNGVHIIPAGPANIGDIADPLKTISSITIQIAFVSPMSSQVLSESYNIPIKKCCGREFYFVSEPGGFDTIHLNSEEDINLSISSTEAVGFMECEGDILKGGKFEAEKQAFEVFTAYAKITDQYDDKDWLREFLKSSTRYVRITGTDEVRKIRMLTDSVPLIKFDDKVYAVLEYVLNYDLNTQNAQ